MKQLKNNLKIKKSLLCLLLALCCLLSLGCGRSQTEQTSPDEEPPAFFGIHNIEIWQGDGIAYREGVSAVDDRDGTVPFTVDAAEVNKNAPGIYTVYYLAIDAAGNEALATATVTVKAREITYGELWEKVDALIAERDFDSLSTTELCTELYNYIKGRMSYGSTSDKTDWVAEAYRGLSARSGDCFTYYAVARAFFERLGVEVLTVQRTPNVLPTTHYWLLVNVGNGDEPSYYHWDACPHPMEHPLTSILLTDAELLAYNEKVPHYYTFDQNLYPATPIK